MSANDYEKKQNAVCCSSGNPSIRAGVTDYRCQGDVVTLEKHEMRMYIVKPGEVSASTPVVILFYDIFGLDIVNTRRFADLVSSKLGACVIMPDFFLGKPWPLDNFPPSSSDELSAWIASDGNWLIVRQMLTSVIEYLKEKKLSTRRMGAIGFCWGGKQVMRCCADDVTWPSDTSFAAGVSIHGAWLGVDDAKKLLAPVLFMPTGEDPPIDQLRAVIDSKPDIRDKCQYYTFVDEIHGFAAARGDLSKQSTREAVEKAITMTADFLKTNL